MAAAGEIVARPVNLAQASQSRLGETNRDSPKPVCARGRPGDPLKFLSERASRPGERGMDSKCDAYEELISGRVNSLGSLGETSGVPLQWSERNPMAPGSGCPWWCPIRITSSGVSRGIHHKCKHPLNPTKLYVSG
ncbi:hypothetical protein DEO72_LG4g1110 [Vigna unguiculata]|uniref:Uncharacterized protein n=1 Tax=Vigna unguiculata TaxID=3917 RepID=A0A4D6LPS6_VIGUN|nr:hypothetical protein DEO72_LG4g1110 [Vigna unguiculata]